MTDKPVGAGMFQVNENDEIQGMNRRFILFSNALLINIFEQFRDLLGPVAKRRIYEVGYSSGKMGGEKMREIFKGGIEQFNQHLNLAGALGWGKLVNVEHDESTGKIVIEYPNAWEADGYKEAYGGKISDTTLCNMIAGLAAGAAEGAFEVPYEGEEETCVGKGDTLCRFVLTPLGEERKVMK